MLIESVEVLDSLPRNPNRILANRAFENQFYDLLALVQCGAIDFSTLMQQITRPGKRGQFLILSNDIPLLLKRTQRGHILFESLVDSGTFSGELYCDPLREQISIRRNRFRPYTAEPSAPRPSQRRFNIEAYFVLNTLLVPSVMGSWAFVPCPDYPKVN